MKAESVWWTRAQVSKLITMMDCPLYTKMYVTHWLMI